MCLFTNSFLSCPPSLPPSAIPAGGAGVITGALILFCAKLKGRKVVVMNWVVALLTVPITLAFLVHCPTLELAGVNVNYPDG